MIRRHIGVTASLLALLIALDALTIDISLPAMPAIGRSLGAGQIAVEISLSAYLLGIAIGQLIQGPASDRFGRKPVLLMGLSLYVLASLACAAAPTITVLIAARFVQGLAASTGQILVRAIVRDKFVRDDAAKLLSLAMLGLAFAPIIAPILGSHLTAALGWRSIFLVLAGYSAIIGLLFFRFFEESNTHLSHQALAPRLIVQNYRIIMSCRIFWAYGLCGAAAFSGLFAFLTASPGVFINYLELSPIQFGRLFAVVMVGHMVTLLVGARLVHRFGLDTLLCLGVTLAAISGLTAAGLGWASSQWSAVFITASIAGPVAVFMIAFAIIIPTSVAGAMAPFGDKAGAAASLMGFLQFAGAASVAAVVTLVSDGSHIAMVTAIGAMGVAALVFWLLLVRPIIDANSAVDQT